MCVCVCVCVCHLLLEVPPLLLVHQDQVEVVADTELLVDIPHGGREVVAGQEETDGDGLPSHWSTVHDLILSNLFILSVDVGRCVSVYVCVCVCVCVWVGE